MSLKGKASLLQEKAGVDHTPHQESTFQRFAIAMANNNILKSSQFLEQLNQGGDEGGSSEGSRSGT